MAERMAEVMPIASCFMRSPGRPEPFKNTAPGTTFVWWGVSYCTSLLREQTQH